MRVDRLAFTITVEAGDTAPSGTVQQQAVAMWNAIKNIPLADLTVTRLEYDTVNGLDNPTFTVEAKEVI